MHVHTMYVTFRRGDIDVSMMTQDVQLSDNILKTSLLAILTIGRTLC